MTDEVKDQSPAASTAVAVTGDQPAQVMAMMLEAAKSMDTEKLEKLMNLQERMLNRNAKAAYDADFVRMKPELPRVAKRKDNTQTKSKYAPLEDINLVVDPILAKHGFGTTTKVIGQNERDVTVRATLKHRDGHEEFTDITMPLDDRGIAGTVNKTLPHATSSSITYAKRVAVCALLNISTGDDLDGNKPQVEVSHEQAVEIDQKIAAVKADKQMFLAFMGVDDVRKIKASDYQKALAALKAKEKQAKKGTSA